MPREVALTGLGRAAGGADQPARKAADLEKCETPGLVCRDLLDGNEGDLVWVSANDVLGHGAGDIGQTL